MINWKSWVRSLALSAGVTAVLIFVFSFLLYRFRLGSDLVNLMVCAGMGIASFAGAFLLGKHAPSRRFLWGLGFGLVYLIIRGLTAWVLLGVAPLPEIPAALSMLAGGMAGGMLS